MDNRVAGKKALIEVALGQRMADIYIENGRLINVYTGEIMEGQGIALLGPKIAYVGPAREMVGEATQVIDAGGAYLAPGYIDAHCHCGFLSGVAAATAKMVATGTTTVLADAHDLVGAAGPAAIEYLLKATVNLPLKYYLAIPAADPPYPEWEGDDYFSLADLVQYLDHPRVMAISEITPWLRIVAGEDDLLQKIVTGETGGWRIEGHTSGCSFSKLNAVAAAGITSCHESIQAEEVLNRLRLGIHTMLRHGSIRADLPALAPAIVDNPGLDTSRVMLTPDFMNPPDMVEHGYLDYVITAAIRNGIPPVKAIQMATINPATYMRVEHRYGGIGPGKVADILVLDAPDRPTPRLVIANGQIIARNGQVEYQVAEITDQLGWRVGRYPKQALTPENFSVAAPISKGVSTVPVISIVDKTITRREDQELRVENGLILPDSAKDIHKISMLHKDGDRFVTGFIKGFNIRIEGLASSLVQESYHPTVIGSSDEGMVRALNRLLENGGGMVIVEDGQVVVELSLPLAGMMSTGSLEEVAGGIKAFNSYFWARGCTLEDPFWTIGFIGFSGLPFIRVTPSGILDVRAGKIIFGS